MSKKPKILIANGVNLDLLGTREKAIYGKENLIDLKQRFKKLANYELDFFQSNSEEKFLEKITGPWAGVVINPGAWTHTSLALSDRIRGLPFPFVEVHISNIFGREPIRQQSLTAASCVGLICGFGLSGYEVAVELLINHIKYNGVK